MLTPGLKVPTTQGGNPRNFMNLKVNKNLKHIYKELYFNVHVRIIVRIRIATKKNRNLKKCFECSIRAPKILFMHGWGPKSNCKIKKYFTIVGPCIRFP
jgi:hypothetical protein